MITGESPRFPSDPAGHEGLKRELQRLGARFDETWGKYGGTPERTLMVYGLPREHLVALGQKYGQEAVIHSENGQHQFIYTNGPKIGQMHLGTGTHEHWPEGHEPPADDHTRLPGHGHVRLHFDWNNTHAAAPAPVAAAPAPAPGVPMTKHEIGYRLYKTLKNTLAKAVPPKFHEQFAGQTLPFYGVDNNYFKLGDKVYQALEDPDDGYRSYLQSIEETQPPQNSIFFPNPVANVRVEPFDHDGEDYVPHYSSDTGEEQGHPQFKGYRLVDAETGHPWLTVGTNYHDDYYPSFHFRYQPKTSPDQKLDHEMELRQRDSINAWQNDQIARNGALPGHHPVSTIPRGQRANQREVNRQQSQHTAPPPAPTPAPAKPAEQKPYADPDDQTGMGARMRALELSEKPSARNLGATGMSDPVKKSERSQDVAETKTVTVPEVLHGLYKTVKERVTAFEQQCLELRKAELAKKSPPGRKEEVEKLKAKGLPASEAFGIAWKQHNESGPPDHKKAEKKPGKNVLGAGMSAEAKARDTEQSDREYASKPSPPAKYQHSIHECDEASVCPQHKDYYKKGEMDGAGANSPPPPMPNAGAQMTMSEDEKLDAYAKGELKFKKAEMCKACGMSKGDGDHDCDMVERYAKGEMKMAKGLGGPPGFNAAGTSNPSVSKPLAFGAEHGGALPKAPAPTPPPAVDAVSGASPVVKGELQKSGISVRNMREQAAKRGAAAASAGNLMDTMLADSRRPLAAGQPLAIKPVMHNPLTPVTARTDVGGGPARPLIATKPVQTQVERVASAVPTHNPTAGLTPPPAGARPGAMSPILARHLSGLPQRKSELPAGASPDAPGPKGEGKMPGKPELLNGDNENNGGIGGKIKKAGAAPTPAAPAAPKPPAAAGAMKLPKLPGPKAAKPGAASAPKLPKSAAPKTPAMGAGTPALKGEITPGNKGHRVKANVLGKEKSQVFSTREAAEKFAESNKHRNPTIDEVDMDPKTGKIKK